MILSLSWHKKLEFSKKGLDLQKKSNKLLTSGKERTEQNKYSITMLVREATYPRWAGVAWITQVYHPQNKTKIQYHYQLISIILRLFHNLECKKTLSQYWIECDKIN